MNDSTLSAHTIPPGAMQDPASKQACETPELRSLDVSETEVGPGIEPDGDGASSGGV